MSLLDVRGFTKSFYIHHLGRTVPAFDALDFQLEAGQFLLVRGPNGVGKSTLLRCLYRTYRATGGEAIYQSLHGPVDLVRAADVDIIALRSEEIGFVTQFLRARPRVTTLELVMEPLLGAGVAADEADAQARAILEAFGLKEELWATYPTTFSGGEQQKVNLARALIRPCRLLLLDEPTASLDAAARQSVIARLGALKAAGVAMIGVFHYPEEVAHLVDHEILLSAPMMGL